MSEPKARIYATPPMGQEGEDLRPYENPAQSEPLTDEAHARVWREEAWQCYVESGADPDGADARHLNPGEALAAVKELRQDYDSALDESRPTSSEALEGLIEKLEAEADKAEGASENALEQSGVWLEAGWADGLRQAAQMARDALPEGTQAHEPATEGVPDE